jgi:hypothetical protein
MQKLRPHGVFLAILCFVAAARAADAPAKTSPAADQPDARGIEYFEMHVRPLLVKHCYECHSGEKEIKGRLSLDSRSGWETGGDSGAAIVPGNLEESLLIEAIRYESYEMPPKGKLSDADIAVFEKWVEMGAPDPRDGSTPDAAPSNFDIDEARQFWAFQLPEPHRPPAVKETAWPRDDIDRFILARLEERDLVPAADVDAARWLRRITYDLTGLPPTPQEMAAFLADSDADAREKVVDRLLASPQFGVHWGRHWLDVARYADSNGSDFNATFFNAWRYRNYVIDSFNRDKPFDRFVREQIAGDLLGGSSDDERAEQLIATTFLTVGPKMLSERDKMKLTMDVVDEQIDSVGKAFLGMTLGCARCHDHKFDPIPTEDYYALAGIFRSTITLEGESQQYVSAWVETPLPISAELARAIEEHKQHKDRLNVQLTEAKDRLKQTEAQLAQLDLGRQGVIVDDVDAKVVGDWKDSKYSPNYVGAGYIHDEKTGKGEKSVTWTPNLPHAGEYEVRISFAGGSGRDSAIPVKIVHAAGSHDLKLDQSQTPPINKLFKSLGTFRFEAGSQGSVTLSTEGTTGFVIADAVQFIPQDQTPAPEEVADASDELPKLRKTVAGLNDQVKKLEADLKKHDAEAPVVPTAMAAREAPEIGDCEIFIRGEIRHRGKVVDRGFLRVVSDSAGQVERKDESGRRELADWIARSDNPLTARVMVNRIWQNMLGEGIVRSVDNFGHLGEAPSHPELLDTLAVEFVENGWSVKSLVRRIALTRTYAMSTQYDSRAFELDPDNRLLWRANRKRLPAEALRDSMLQFSDRLDLSPGESPVAGMGRLAVDNSKQELTGDKTETLRRSVYLPIVRNQLPSFLTVFDFADPDLTTGRRPETNVPSQSLFLLNDPFVKQQAAFTAQRILAAESEDDGRVDAVFHLILGRPAGEDERRRIVEFVSETVGGDVKQQPDAWRQVVQSLLASTEFRMLD